MNQLMSKLLTTLLLATFVIMLFSACTTGDDFRSAPPPPGTSGATGDTNEPAQTPPTPVPTPTISAPPSPTPTPSPHAATVTKEGCYDRGYGGRIRDPNNSRVDIYLLVEPPLRTSDYARAISETLCVAGGRYTPPGEVHVIKANYTLKQLNEWHARIRDEVLQVQGLWSTDLDVAKNSLQYGVLSESAKSNILEIAGNAGIPNNAIYVQIPPQIELDTPQPTPSASGMMLSLDYPPEVTSGEPVDFEVTVTNLNEIEKIIEYNGAVPADVVILDADGQEVWRLITGGINLPGGGSRLSSGDSVTFTVEWDGLDHDDIALSPGQYAIRGFVRLRFADFAGTSSTQLTTTPTELQITAN
jgi:hypothetical protein